MSHMNAPAMSRLNVTLDIEALSFKATMLFLAGISIVLLLAPTVIVLIVSFTSDYSLRFPPTGFSLQWYAALTEDAALKLAAWNSFKIAIATTFVSVVLGVAAALSAESNRNVQVLRGILNRIAEQDATAAEVLFDEALLHEILAPWFPILQSAVPINSRGMARLRRSLASNMVPITRVHVLAWR